MPDSSQPTACRIHATLRRATTMDSVMKEVGVDGGLSMKASLQSTSILAPESSVLYNGNRPL